MKLKLIYTGNPAETRIVNAETGEEIQNVVRVDVAVDAMRAEALIEVTDLELDLDNVEAVYATNQDDEIS